MGMFDDPYELDNPNDKYCRPGGRMVTQTPSDVVNEMDLKKLHDFLREFGDPVPGGMVVDYAIDLLKQFFVMRDEVEPDKQELTLLRELAEAVCGWRIHYEQKYPEELRIADRFDDWRELKEGKDDE